MQHYDSSFDHVGDFVERWNEGVRGTRALAIGLGALLALAGVASLASPLSLYAVIQTVIAVALIAGGTAGIVGYVRTPELFRSPVALVTGILNALLGVLVLALPSYLTAGTLTLLLAFLFIASGAERLSSAHRMRYFGFEGTGVSTATGVLNIVAGVVFLIAPLFSSLVLGYLMAAYLIVAGASLMAEGVAMRPIGR